jgi:hypothetical protein
VFESEPVYDKITGKTTPDMHESPELINSPKALALTPRAVD